jgi:hypothetical protein
MIATDPINYPIAATAAALPVAYLMIVVRTAKGDIEHTEEISREPGQTNHTGILDLHSADGHHDNRGRNNLHAAVLPHAMAQG